ncbi:M23 family metallopeptidase [Mucilaginibacter terrae]|uniref:M23ase beta-sheet core domain-containing protein n=1 Tax=Mucilaginibacter terrae TaxID=1955052 RepID=A0ABU3GXE4_9SPHI|nr:M23 family metallopeptidase [Mucilaginibacter terrae]MDT3404433.1 hypothetical protein [Mucilaginibacter terrae]
MNTPKFLTIILLFIFCGTKLYAQQNAVVNYCIQLDSLNKTVTNNTIDRKTATKKLTHLITQIDKNAGFNSPDAWTFPLKGYKANAIGGVKGNGYFDKGYHFLDGNKHTAHPAHDIFITDRNQDTFDDKTLKPVEVLAVTDGVVVSCTPQWDVGSALRGGKCIWVYHPGLNLFSYYAHNRQLFVKTGDVVKRGQKIAEVGRTGLNAYKKRSPTHLHFSAFRLVNGLPVPFNPYQNLIKASTL